jgi:hypothetical protein
MTAKQAPTPSTVKAKAAVLITVLDGTADYIAVGQVSVVVVDFDRHERDSAFPDDLDHDIRAVQALPPPPGTDDVLQCLLEAQRRKRDQIRSAPATTGDH